MSFSCERQRNIITLTLDFHFPWIISFLSHFCEHISPVGSNEESYVLPVMRLPAKLWFTVEMKHETCLKYALWKCSYQQSTVITQPDRQLFPHCYQPVEWQWLKVSAEYLLFILPPYVLWQPCKVKIISVVIHRALHLRSDCGKLFLRNRL